MIQISALPLRPHVCLSDKNNYSYLTKLLGGLKWNNICTHLMWGHLFQWYVIKFFKKPHKGNKKIFYVNVASWKENLF